MQSSSDYNLSQLLTGQHALIRAVDAEAGLHQRLTALGFKVNKPISVIRRASFNGPMHVRLGATDVILRPQDAKRIRLQLHNLQPTSP